MNKLQSRLEKSLFIWGFIPCIVAGALWVPALIGSFWVVIVSLFEDGFPSLSEATSIIFIWSLGGLSGAIFFARVKRHLQHNRCWDNWCYILGIHGLLAASPLFIAGIYSFADEVILYGWTSDLGWWPILVVVYLASPIIMFFVAWYHRPKPGVNITANISDTST